METVKCIYHTGPVTALYVLGKKIIAGCGDYLYGYDVETTKCLQRISVLPCSRIHGIRSNGGDLLCVFGEKKSCIVEVQDELKNTDKGIQLQDLIWDAQFLTENANHNTEVVFALAHNTIIRWDTDQGQVLDLVQCEENNILYCARFITSVWSKLILAAGTVTNQVLLWSPMTTKDSAGQSTVMHRFKGHQGVIFSIRYNPDRHQICSVSDDRSIRIWQLTFPNKGNGNMNDLELLDWEQCESIPIHVLYGHSARVWDINLLSDVMVSIGEDSVCCVWNYKGEIIQKYKGHKGKSIWSLAADKEEQFFVTGGEDTSIRMWKLNQTGNQTPNKIQCTSLPFPDKDDFVRTVSFWRSDFVLGMTNEGSLLIHSIVDKFSSTIFTDVNYQSYTIMSVSDVICVGNINGTLRLINANQFDSIEDIKFTWRDYNMFEGKVFSIQWLSESYLLTTGPDGEIHLYSHSSKGDNNGDLKLVKRLILPYCKQRWVSAAALMNDGKGLICGDRAGTVHLYRWVDQGDKTTEPVQSFWKIHGKTGVTDIRVIGDIVYTTGRDGHYRTFDMASEQLVLLNSNRVSKGFDWLDKLELQSDGDIYIYGFQSDSFVLFSINNNQRLVQIPCGGGHRTWDCRINNDKVTFVYLKMKEVVLYRTELLTNQVMIKESLHGRETTCFRNICSFMCDSKPVNIILTCSEDTTVQVSKLNYNDSGIAMLTHVHTFKDHISNVKCMTTCASNNSGSHLVFTGGSRAQLVITKITIMHAKDCDDVKMSFQTLKSCHLGEEWLTRKQKKSKLFKSNPETRIMDLCVVVAKDILHASLDHLYVLGSACSDGFVRFYLFDENSKTLSPICESIFHDHCVLNIISSFVTLNNRKQCILLSAGTDGRIALWDISELVKQFLFQNGYDIVSSNKALHQNDLQRVSPHSKTGISLMNGSIPQTPQSNASSNDLTDVDKSEQSRLSDGGKCNEACNFVNVSDGNIHSNHGEENQQCEPIFAISSHQSGVNGLSSFPLHDGRLMIASGGDDNALVVSIISIIEDGKVKVEGMGRQSSAHAAQITGVYIINPSTIVTASVDQRMCLWRVDCSDSELKCSMVWCKFVNVPDIANMELWETKDKIVIGLCGEGLTVYEIDKNKI